MTCIVLLALSLVFSGCQRSSDSHLLLPADAALPARGLVSQTPTRVSEALTLWPPIFHDFAGDEHRPLDDPDVKAIALVFIVPDCPVVNSYAPQLNRLHESFTPLGIKWLLVHVDPDVTAQQAGEHAEQYALQAPIVRDAEHRWVTTTGVSRTPEVAVLSPLGERLYRGRIDDRYVDWGQRRLEATTHDLRDALEAIVAGRPVAQPTTDAVGCFIPD